MIFKQQTTHLVKNPHTTFWLAVLGLVVYLLQSFVYIFTSGSMLDEGLYLLKGWYFATGQYIPFQDYGVLTNHMPLAFLIPGYIQSWFGPGLLAGRLFAVAVGFVAVWATWHVARRLGGEWWGQFALWAMVLNPAMVRTFSMALSQGLVVALTAVSLWLSLRRKPKAWQVLLAGGLMGILTMVRVNMLPLVGLWLLYILWEHKSRMFWVSIAGFALVFLGVHLAYWPNILRMWAYWIPEGWVEALEPFYTPWNKYTGRELTPNWGWLSNLDDPAWDPIISFWLAMRFNFVVMVGFIANILLWPMNNAWPDQFTKRLAIFLNTAFLALLLVHMWAALGNNSCTSFCFSGYVVFLGAVGLLSIVVTAPYWRRDLPALRQGFLAMVLVLLCAGIGFGAVDKIGRFVAELPVPRLSADPAPLWAFFHNKYGLSFNHSRQVLSALAGLGVGLVLLTTLPWLLRRCLPSKTSWTAAALLGLFAGGYLLTSTPLFALGDETLKCGGNLVRSYAQAGRELSPLLHVGERLYYHGPNSPAILLYLPAVQIYPAQLNNVFAFSTASDGSDSERLERFGYWNEQLKEEWSAEADVVLLETRRFAEWRPLTDSGEFNIVYVGEDLEPCRPGESGLVLLRRSNQE